MKLLCPIKKGILVKKWYASNRELKSLADFYLCQSQGFGENPQTYAWLNLNGHNGLDIAYENGTEVFASHDGIAEAQQDSHAGLGVVITGKECKTIYWHLKETIKPMWSKWEVKAGDLIGYGDNTGWSTGPHLHYGLKLLDTNGDVIGRDNGFDGAIDPTPYIAWFDTMTQNEVNALQVLEGYQDSSGQTYWSNKELKGYLIARLEHKIAQETEVLNKLKNEQ